MDYISLAMLILGAIGIVLGFLFGKKRGLSKAIVRLILVVIAAVAAFLMREKITEIVLNVPVEDGKTIIELLTESIASGEDAAKMEGFVNVITNVLTMVLQILVFIITFIALRIATLILYWIIAAIIKASNKSKVRETIRTDIDNFEEGRRLSRKQKKLLERVKDDQEALKSDDLDKKSARKIKKNLANNEKKLIKKTVKRDRKKWRGGFVGMLQGAVVVICIVAPISGLVLNVSSLVKSVSTLEIDGEKLLDEEITNTLEEIGIYKYPESKVAEVYDYAGGWLYRELSKVENTDGSQSNIQSQIEAVQGGVEMVDAVTKLTEVNMEEGLTEEVKDQVVDIFNNLDEIKSNMSEESVQELDKLMKEALTPMLGDMAEELPIDLGKLDFAEVDFAKEGEVVSSFYDLYIETEQSDNVNEEEVIEEVITTLSDSTLILPILSQVVEELPEEEKPNFTEEEKAQIEDILEGLENQENVDAIKALFGIN
jgi:hypothetical protein